MFGSYKDPMGFVHEEEEVIFRRISLDYKKQYDTLISSGLYKVLTDNDLLVPHREIRSGEDYYKIIQPSRVPFITYPYEWCFGQLKAAALLTLHILKISIEHGMILRDASAYNVQFLDNKPIFIDTLSFEPYAEGNSWKAYRQFCEHFLAPLAMLAYTDGRLGASLLNYLDGFPLDLAKHILPPKAWLNFGLMTHVFLHAKAITTFQNNKKFGKSVSKTNLYALIDSLESTVRRLHLKNDQSEWGEYYEDIHYTDTQFEQKRLVVTEFVKEIGNVDLAVDMGANRGVFSEILSSYAKWVVAIDNDHKAVERAYSEERGNVIPLVIDLANPSPSLGWRGQERMAFVERIRSADVVLALALAHHLLFTHKIPLKEQAEFFASTTRSLIIEFVDPSEDQVEKIAPKQSIVTHPYSKELFEKAFGKFFDILDIRQIEGRARWIYRMRHK